ncbi:unnamed protein product [Mytilus edulis]|uniref:Endonuclease/exonuclease/phosphatase domain-containing protein n=1 Tax=Mytilus edulis TaxID=6550 RepID=A0A8S3VBE0_MYTED|nr:unnamed protein product [Mytilus edulis]
MQRDPGQDNPASTRSVNDIYDLLTKVSNNQESLRQSMEQRITNLEVSFKTEISSKMKSLKDEINIEFAKFDNEIQSLKHKIDTLEKGESNTQVSQNITHSKLVFKNVPNTDTGDSEDSLKAYINGIITYLELDFNVTTVQCVGSNANQQNKTVLVNFDNETQRVNVLKKKRKLKDNPMYSHVYVESDKTRHERMQEANIRKIIKTIPSLEIRGGSGGVGFLVSKSILENFTCSVLNDNYEDILWISLKCKNDINFVIHLCVCYLQPERSSRGNIAQEYYDVLLSQIYLYSGCSNLFVCGDFNGRIGNLQDFDDKIDFIPEKSSIDDVRNAFGNYFLDFIKDAKLCVLNGRSEKDSDNYTYVSKTGKSVVDYIAVPYADLNKYSKFKVQLISDILLLFDITPAAKATIPDHSILSCSLSISDYTSNYSENCNDSNVCSKRRKYNVCNVPNDIFANQRCTRAILSVIEQMENCLNVKNEIDKLYGNFVTVLHSEMDNHLPFKDVGGNVTKKRRKQIQKPYWNTELRELLTEVNRSEKDYLKYKGCKRTQDFLRSNFIEKRKQFDKRLRQCERTHQASIRDKIKNLNDSNPKEFWREIDKLGPQKHRPDIDSVRMEDGSFSTDQETILKRWKSEYSKLFKLDNTLVNDTFIDNLSELTEQLEREFNSVTDEDDEILAAELFNENISIEETEEAMRLVKLGKAVGVDNLPNEILCNKILTVPLQKLFDMCFTHEKYKKTWYNELKSVMEKCELLELFNNNYTNGLNVKFIANYSELLLRQKHHDKWKLDIVNMPKLRTFRCLETNFEKQQYITTNMTRQQRSTLARMRCGTFPLELELGRYRGIPSNRRFCKVCNDNVSVEDEKHFLVKCPLYLCERNNAFADFQQRNNIDFSVLSDDEILIKLLTTDCKLVSNYIFNISKIRTQLLSHCDI